MHIGESVARAMFSAKGEYLDATFEAIRAQYGSVDRYLSEEGGLDGPRRMLLRSKYLE